MSNVKPDAALPQGPRSTGLMEMDYALGGGWPPGAIVELQGDDVALVTALDGVTLVDNPAPAEAIRTAAVMLAAGSVVAIYTGTREHAARDAALTNARAHLARHAAQGGGTLLLVYKVPMSEEPRDNVINDVSAIEARMRAEVDAMCGGAAGPALTARVVTGGPVASDAPMRFFVGHPLPDADAYQPGDGQE